MDRRAVGWGALYGIVCALAALAMRGFTVDDALISVRYAHNLATGHGYRWNVGESPSDGVTPLPWPFLLALFARGGALATLGRAKAIGLVSWALSAGALGVTVGRQDVRSWIKAAGLLLLVASLPVAAHAASGMETAVVMSLATLSVASCERPAASTCFAGLAAAFRPELMPWAVAWSAGRSVARQESGGRLRTALHVCGAVTPFLACAVSRAVAFGHPYPLAVLAKPSDLEHGGAYAAVGFVVSAIPVACVAPWSLTRGSGIARAIAAAFVCHTIVVALVGGDWMPYARLFAPVVPGLALLFVLSAAGAPAWSVWARAGVGTLIGAYFWVSGAPKGMGVASDRAALVAEARPELAVCERVAAVDVGWVSAAVDVDVVDLAGLTDPFIAALPGGHTSKRVDAGMLLDRGVDCAVFYVDPGFHQASIEEDPRAISFAHAVSGRLVQSEVWRAHFIARSKLALGSGDRGYVVFIKTR